MSSLLSFQFRHGVFLRNNDITEAVVTRIWAMSFRIGSRFDQIRLTTDGTAGGLTFYRTAPLNQGGDLPEIFYAFVGYFIGLIASHPDRFWLLEGCPDAGTLIENDPGADNDYQNHENPPAQCFPKPLQFWLFRRSIFDIPFRPIHQALSAIDISTIPGLFKTAAYGISTTFAACLLPILFSHIIS
jgi:hypothetical protein